jgi:hypothetical protein
MNPAPDVVKDRDGRRFRRTGERRRPKAGEWYEGLVGGFAYQAARDFDMRSCQILEPIEEDARQ